jgi:Flp pilus assembly protein TadB
VRAVVPALLAAVAVYLARPYGGRGRTGRSLPLSPPRAGRAVPEPARRRAAAVLGGLGVAAVLGGVAGLLAAPVVAYALDHRIARLPARAEVRRDRHLVRRLPVACDLLAACLAAGAPVHESVAAVAAAVGGPLGAELSAVARRWLLTGSAESAWAGVAAAAPGGPLHPVAVACRRAERGGASLRALLGELAEEARDAARAEGEAAARRAGVHAVAPLGLCFLPAFVLLGVVPLVAGMLARLL